LNRINSIAAQGAAQDALLNCTVFSSRNGVEDPKRGNKSSSDVLADSSVGRKKAAPKRSGSKKGEHSQKVDGLPISSSGIERPANKTRARGVPKG
jgi:hypothetical protein